MCYNQSMKRLVLLTICITLFFAAGCSAQESEQSLFDIDISSGESPNEEAEAPHKELFAQGVKVAYPEAVPQEEPEQSPSPDAAPKAEVSVTGTAAYIFQGQEGITLYGAAAYTNTGNCPVVISNAAFDFTINGAPRSFDFVPALNDITVVLPGETSFVTFWQADESLSVDMPVSLSASLSCQQAEASRITVSPSNIYLADNYPGFTTMTGSISADAPCSLNLVYIGFYNEADELLGVWHFTKNANLEVGETKTFTVHMKELPIDDLGAQTAHVRVMGVGF